MAEIKEILCLANSVKHSERCVAGVEVIDRDTINWVRPVSARSGHGVSLSEQRLQDGSELAPLDIVKIKLVEPRPEGFQSENWLLDPSKSWQKVGRGDWETLEALEESPNTLWANGSSSSNGCNDRVTEEQVAGMAHSLALVRTRDLVIRVQPEYSGRGVRARFTYNGSTYILKVTDPVYRHAYLNQSVGDYAIGEAFLTVSLAEVFADNYGGRYAYKVVAAIFERSKVDG